MLQFVLEFFSLITIGSPFLYYLGLFFTGLFFGSFFKVIVDRSASLYDEEYHLKNKNNRKHNHSWIKGRSCCDHCQQQLAWYDNIPLFSYLLLGGRCRSCKQPVGISYPLYELFTGLLFVLSGYISLNSWIVIADNPLVNLLFVLITCSILWLIFLFDLKYMIIPDELVILTAFFGLIKVFYNWQNSLKLFDIYDLVVATCLLLLFILLRYLPVLISNKYGMGLGDIKLIFPLAFLLGYQRAAVAVFCAFILGGVWGIILLINKKVQFGQVLSFGPFLVIGSLASLIWGLDVWRMYWQLL